MNQQVTLPKIKSGGSIKAIVPQNFDEAWRIATAVNAAGMAPETLNSAEKCMVAIMHGLEVGFTPMTALQSIAVIKGQPTIYGDGALALVKASGQCEYIKEWDEIIDSVPTAFCETKRISEPNIVVRSFSDADAQLAGLLDKKGPWKHYRPRMRQMRSRSFTLRDVYPDILKGLRIREEIDDYIDVTPVEDSPPSPPPAPEFVETPETEVPGAEIVEAEIVETLRPDEIMDRFMTCNYQEALDETLAELSADIDTMSDGEQAAIQKVFKNQSARFEEMEQAS